MTSVEGVKVHYAVFFLSSASLARVSARNIPPSDLPYDMLDTPLSSGGYPPCSLLHLQRTEGTFAAIISTNESHTPMDIGDKVNSSILNYRMICDTVGVRFLKDLCSSSTRHGNINGHAPRT